MRAEKDLQAEKLSACRELRSAQETCLLSWGWQELFRLRAVASKGKIWWDIVTLFLSSKTDRSTKFGKDACQHTSCVFIPRMLSWEDLTCRLICMWIHIQRYSVKVRTRTILKARPCEVVACCSTEPGFHQFPALDVCNTNFLYLSYATWPNSRSRRGKKLFSSI